MNLGCRVNQDEGMAILATFRHRGWEVVDFKATADVYIINTCTVTHLADRKSRQLIKRAIQKSSKAMVVACGCYAQVSADDIGKIEGVDLIIGTEEKHRIFELVTAQMELNAPQTFVSDISHGGLFHSIEGEGESAERTRGFLKIQEGCNEFCTYCIVPYARGRERSKPFNEVIEQVKLLVQLGHKEIVLSGIHIGNYGKDLIPATSLANLILAIGEISGVNRLRFGSIEPLEVTDELIKAIATTPAACHQLHIPLQSGANNTLIEMGRKYSTIEFAEIIAKIRQAIPDVLFTTDLMVGFPNETEEDFLESYNFVNSIGFAKIHVFPYSKREGTPAATFKNQVSPENKKIRVKKIMELDEKSFIKIGTSLIGSTTEVLIDQIKEINGNTCYIGYDRRFLPFMVQNIELKKGEIVEISINSVENQYICGEVLTN